MKKYILMTISILIVTTYSMNSQIYYNIEMPKTAETSGLVSIQDLPEIEFNPGNKGAFFETGINKNIKEHALTESNSDKLITRLNISVKTNELGFMSIRLRDVSLKNVTYCYIYTDDYKVIAGPVNESSIKDKINIVQIPAKNLIVEVVASSLEDWNLILDEVSFKPLKSEDRNKKTAKLMSPSRYDFCSGYNYGETEYYDDYESDETFGASELLHKIGEANGTPIYADSSDKDALFGFASFNSINDLPSEDERKVSRAACMIIGDEFWEEITENEDGTDDTTRHYYKAGKPGTLINLPAESCGEGTIIASNHTNLIKNIEYFAISKWNIDKFPDSLDRRKFQDSLDNIIIRFNWHYKYGTPYYLENIICGDETTLGFKLWRETIDFDEVIDYCGVEVLKSTHGGQLIPDVVILKMQQKPFYKELHLGWSTQTYYDYEDSNYGEFTDAVTNPEDFKIIGRRAFIPTLAITPSIFGYSNLNLGMYEWKMVYKDIQNSDDDYYVIGWSGSQLVYKSTCSALNNQILGLGVVESGKSDDDFMGGYLYSKIFINKYGWDGQWKFYNHTAQWEVGSTSEYNWFYKDYLKNHQTFYDSTEECHKSGEYFYWKESQENSEKCPSQETVNCDFDISDYVYIRYSSFGVHFWVNFASIPETINGTNTFSSVDKPEGVRIYHNFGDQRTFYYENWANQLQLDEIYHQSLSTEGLAEFFIPAEEIYIYKTNHSPAFTELELKFDFYDENGRVYEVDCPDDKPNTISVPIDGTYTDPQGNTQERIIDCDFFAVRAVQTSEIGGSGTSGEDCCLFKLEIFIPGPEEGLAPLHNLYLDMTAQTGNVQCYSSDAPTNDMGLTFSMDYEKGVIASEEFCVDSPGSIDIDFVFNDGDFWQNCIKTITLSCSDEPVDCCDNVELYIKPLDGPWDYPPTFPVYTFCPYFNHSDCIGDFGNITVEYLDSNNSTLETKHFTNFNSHVLSTYPTLCIGPANSVSIRITIVIDGVPCILPLLNYNSYF
jgi:hypothetical protein